MAASGGSEHNGGDQPPAWPFQPSAPPTAPPPFADDLGAAPTEPELTPTLEGPFPTADAPTTPFFHDVAGLAPLDAPGGVGSAAPPAYGPAAYPPPPYGYGGPYGPYAYAGWAPPRNNGLAIASMVCGIGAFVLCQIFAVPGLILGLRARRQIRESGGAETGDAFALAGIILSGIGLVLLVGLVILYVVVIGIAVSTSP